MLQLVWTCKGQLVPVLSPHHPVATLPTSAARLLILFFSIMNGMGLGKSVDFSWR